MSQDPHGSPPVGDWLPPQSPGAAGGSEGASGAPAPLDLGAAAQPPPGAADPGAAGTWAPPAAGQAAGWGQPPTGQAAGWGQPPAGAPGAQPGQPGAQPGQPGAWGQPPAGYGQQQGYGQQYNPYGQPSPWASTYYYSYKEPDNSPGLAGFILSITSFGVGLVFFGLLAPVNIGLSIGGIVASRKGIKKVEAGETRKHKDLARWGFWLGIVGLVISILALAGWLALILSDPEAFEDEFDPDNGDPATRLAPLLGALARAAAGLLG